MKRVLHILFAPIGGAIGYWIWLLLELVFKKADIVLWGWVLGIIEISLISVFAILGYFLGAPCSAAISRGMSKMSKKAKEMSARELFMAVAGLMIGLVCAFLISQIFNKLSNELFVTCINALIYICCGALGLRVALMRRDDYEIPVSASSAGSSLYAGTVLDTSILIDGRAYDIYKTGFLSSPIYIPKFILDELSHLADSDEEKKRTRARMGLDTVKKLQAESNVVLNSDPFSDIENIDDKLIAFAKKFGAAIMTNDYSLNMVASLQGVTILNVNELVNALKPTVVARDEITVELTRPGKTPSQGVGYLDDGTMVVVEDANERVGSFVDIIVTSMLQTNAGKIIFGKIKE